MKTGRLIKRSISVLLATTLTLMLPMNQLATHRADAAKSRETTKYISELKVFSEKDADLNDAKEWCKNQDVNKDSDKENDWKVIDANLNDGAEGALKSKVGVYLCYRTTTDAADAITDIAVMNEKGNYDEGAYDILVEEQRDAFADMVTDMRSMIDKYKENYKNEVQVAINAHDILNTYVEDDSGMLMGDLLLNISDDDLTDILLQANGNVVYTIQDQLASACDQENKTWLDRLMNINSYKKLRKVYAASCKNNYNEADKVLNKNYKTKALTLLNYWDEVNAHFENTKSFITRYSLDEMTFEELEEWVSENVETIEGYIGYEELMVCISLGCYSYDGGTLVDYFSQSYDYMKNNITELYPLAVALTDAQFAALNETVSLFSLIINALGANVYNGSDKGIMEKVEKNEEKGDDEQVEEVKEELEEQVEEFKNQDKISIYEGVDREIFKGGVAVTSAAENYSKGNESSWVNTFVESGYYKKTTIGVGALSIFSGGVAVICTLCFKRIINSETLKFFNLLRTEKGLLTAETAKKGVFHCTVDAVRSVESLEVLKTDYSMEYFNLRSVAKNNSLKFSFVRSLRMGMTMFAILLAIADIALTIYVLYNYYNVSHLPIPHFMVDLTYNDNEMTGYVPYKIVNNQDGSPGDLNGGGGKQWLAIYSTKEEAAGGPILAPEDENGLFLLKYEDPTIPVGCSPVHLFGSPNAAQNLTFADGENGWSYNDNNGGTYLFFKRDTYRIIPLRSQGTTNEQTTDSKDEKSSDKESTELTGTLIADSEPIFAAGIGTVAGLILGILGCYLVMRRRKEE